MRIDKDDLTKYIGYFLATIVVILFLVYAVIPGFLPSSVCVSRQVSGNQVSLNIDVSEFRKSNSFMIEELVNSNVTLIDSNIEPLFNQDSSGRIAWMFWDGDNKIQDQVLTYTLSADSEVSGTLISAKSPYDSEKGYERTPITDQPSCI